MVVVRKKSGDIRLCVDYRALNNVTVKDAHPLPRIQDSFDALAGAHIFSSLDLQSGYHQVPVAEADQPKTAFATPFGLYEYKRMPFGLCGAPGTFQRLMNSVMAEHLFKFLLVYLDDLLVSSKTFEEHLQHLETIFKRLSACGLKINPAKCQLLQEKVEFLGHTVSAEGVSCQNEKTEVIQAWPQPTTTKDLRSFLGSTGYYRRFVKDYATIAAPLHHLSNLQPQTKRKPADITSAWKATHQEAFDTLKKKLCDSETVLAFVDFTRPFVLHTDASFQGLGAVLQQVQPDGRIRPIAYASRSLRPTERVKTNYSAYKLEMLALKWAITEKFRGYLLGRPFRVITDNNPLAHCHTSKLGALEQRWMSQLGMFDFEIGYSPGKTNPADALSRLPPTPMLLPAPPKSTTALPPELTVEGAPVHCNRHYVEDQADPDMPPPVHITDDVSLSSFSAPSHTDIAVLQKQDPVIREVLAAWPNPVISKTPKVRTLSKQHAKLRLRNDVLYRVVQDHAEGELWQVVLPECERTGVLAQLHDAMGHQGLERTLQLLRLRVYWPGMTADTEAYIKDCQRCHLNRPSRRALLLGHLMARRPLEVLGIDFTKLDRSRSGKEQVLVMQDIFTKFVQAVPTNDQTAPTVAKALTRHWFQLLGVPERIHSDQGRDFESELVAVLCNRWNVEKSRTTPPSSPRQWPD